MSKCHNVGNHMSRGCIENSAVPDQMASADLVSTLFSKGVISRFSRTIVKQDLFHSFVYQNDFLNFYYSFNFLKACTLLFSLQEQKIP